LSEKSNPYQACLECTALLFSGRQIQIKEEVGSGATCIFFFGGKVVVISE